jgi:hypothetical protein
MLFFSVTYSSCSNIDLQSHYLDFVFIYKDNVQSTSDCCEFCNSNIRCVVWTLQQNIGRCYLKYKRGSRLIEPGYASGFSNACKIFKRNSF